MSDNNGWIDWFTRPPIEADLPVWVYHKTALGPTKIYLIQQYLPLRSDFWQKAVLPRPPKISNITEISNVIEFTQT